MRLSRIRGKNSLELTVTNENSAAKTALLRLFQFESREKPQSLLALIGMGTLPIMDGWFDQFMPSGVAPGPTGAIDVAAIGGTGTNPLLGPSALTPATTSGASTSQSFESTTHAGSMWSLSPFGDPPGYGGLASLGRDLGGDPASFALTNSGGGQLPGSVDSGSTFTNSNVTSPATTRSSSGTPTTSEPAISTLPPTKGSQPLSTTVTNAVAAAPQSGGGTLMLAGPATDFITPPQRLAPGPNTTFTREFVVELKPGVSSVTEAKRYKATHVFAYPHLDNVNLWKIPAHSDATKFAKLIRGNARIVEAYPVYQAHIAKTSLMNDPMVPAQWHLFNANHTGGTAPNFESNVEAAWDMGMTGKGVLVSVVDDGMEFTHPDLSPRFVHSASWDFRGGATDDDPSPIGSDGHGTSVGGVIAAAGNNGIGTSGVAPDALLGASRLIPGSLSDTQIAEALRWNTIKAANGFDGYDARPIDISNNSWGFISPGALRSIGPVPPGAISESAAQGRGGLGTIYLFAAGNDRTNQDNTNYSILTNNRYAITVAAVADDGEFASYSNPGASILISGLSNGGWNPIVTTDRTGSNGYSRTAYNDSFGGTSSATPFVSGVVAQMLQANPNLTWRDVQHILVRSATRVDAGNVASWDANPVAPGVQTNGGGRYVSHDYGFGLVNALGAVNLASNWQPVGPELIYTSAVDEPAVSVPIPNNNITGISRNINVPTNIRVERVEVIFDTVNHSAIGELNVTLTSPFGTVSRLAEPRLFGSVVTGTSNTVFTTNLPQDAFSGLVGRMVTFTSGANNLESRQISAYNGTTKQITLSAALPAIPGAGDTFSFQADYNDWAFTTTQHWDESSAGDWTLNVSDRVGGSLAGSFSDWQLRIYGTEIAPDTSGPRLIGITSPGANGMVNGGSVGTFRVQFDGPINASTFTTAGSDIALQLIGGSPAAISSITAVPGSNDTTFDIALTTTVSTVGNYRVDIGPNISDMNGNLMNQDGDLTNGEATQDKYSEFFTIASQFIYSNTAPQFVPVGAGALLKTINLPAVNISDLNVLLFVYHDWPSWDMNISLSSAPGLGAATSVIAAQNVGNGLGLGDGGYRATLLDDANTSAPIISATNTSLNHYTDQYRPSNPLSVFNGPHDPGDWTLSITDATDQGLFIYYDLIITPAGVPNIKIDSVTNTDADRDKVEVTYTISNAAASAFDLGIFSSIDPFWNTNSDTQTGTLTVSNAADLTIGQHTIELNANLFPDPNFLGNQEFYSLVVADPNHSLLELAKHDNYGVLEGVTQTADGTLYVSGRPFTSNNFTISNSDVNFNGTSIGYTGASINDIVLTGGTENDTVNAAGVTENILAYLRSGSDTYTGGEATDVVQGGAGHDTIAGNGAGDRLFGMIGTDSVSGGNGNDIVNVGEGQTGGTQFMQGGAGADWLYVTGTQFNDGIMVYDPDENEGVISSNLTVQVWSPATPGSGLGFGAIMQSMTISAVESTDRLIVIAQDGNDRIELRNPSTANTRVGLPAMLVGGSGNDTIFDGLGADLLFGDSAYTILPTDGVDQLNTVDGQNHDTLVGTNGIDTFTRDATDTITFTT